MCGRAQDGDTPLHTAAFSGHLECVRLLLERGADKDAKTKVRAHTRTTAAARCVGARRAQRVVGRGLRSAKSRAVVASAARAVQPRFRRDAPAARGCMGPARGRTGDGPQNRWDP